jgi:hypothetical protein
MAGSYQHGNEISDSIKDEASQLGLCFKLIFQHCSGRAGDTLK